MLFLVLAIIIGILIAIIVLVVLFRDVFVDTETFGTYSPGLISSCPVACGQTGTTTQIQVCVPNPTTGKGCLVDGVQTFHPITTQISCNNPCPSSVWETISTTPCLTYLFGPEPGESRIVECMSGATTNLSTITRKCIVGSNSGGPNHCVLTDGTLAILGQEEVVDMPCTGSTPVCGSVQDCPSIPIYQYAPEVQTTPINSPFNVLLEGLLITGRVCSNDDSVFNLPPDSYAGLCPSAADAFCSPQPIPSSIPNKQIIPTGPVCNNFDRTQGCVGVGRHFPTSLPSSISANLRTLLNRPIYFRYPFSGLTSSLVLSSPPNPATNAPVPILIDLVTDIYLQSLRTYLSPTADFVGNSITVRVPLFDSQNTFGWLANISAPTFYPGQVSYYNGSGMISPGSTYLDAAILTMTVVRFTSAFALPPGVPPGTIQWDVSFNWGTLSNNVTLLMFPPVLSPLFPLV
jgi:hypothetical protein